MMRRWLLGVGVAMVAPLAAPAWAQDVPQIPFDSVPNFLKLPADINLGEAAGVAVNSKGHVFVYSRSGSSLGPAYGNAASQLLEFTPDGKFIREIGKNLYAWSFAHTVRIDKDDNIWATDKGSDMIIKFNNSDGKVMMVFGRKSESSDADAHPLERPKPPLPAVDGRFRQPTDVTWDPAGQHLHQRRLHQFARRQGRQERQVGEAVGRPRQRCPASSTPCTRSPTDAKGNIYVADRGNRRIQVFDGEGNLLNTIKIDVPFDANAVPVIGNKPDLTNCQQVGGTFAPRRAVGGLHHARAEPGPLRRRRLSRAHLQAHARRQGARRARRVRQAAEAVRLDPRDRVPVGERAVRRRDPQLAHPEAAPASRAGQEAGEPVSDFALNRDARGAGCGHFVGCPHASGCRRLTFPPRLRGGQGGALASLLASLADPTPDPPRSRGGSHRWHGYCSISPCPGRDRRHDVESIRIRRARSSGRRPQALQSRSRADRGTGAAPGACSACSRCGCPTCIRSAATPSPRACSSSG